MKSKKGKNKAPVKVEEKSDSDVEMIEAPVRTNMFIDVTTPTPSPKLRNTQLDGPERVWSSRIKDGMFNFPDSPEHPKREVTEPSLPASTSSTANPQSSHDPPGPQAAAEQSEPPRDAPRRSTQPTKTTESYLLAAPGAIGGSSDFAAGEEIHWDIHSLDAIRVASGLVDSHLRDLMWFQDRLVEHHLNLVRTRNLAQKALEGIMRAIYMRDRLDALQGTTVGI